MKIIFINCIITVTFLFTNGCQNEKETYNLDANRKVVLKYHEVFTTGNVNDRALRAAIADLA